MRLRALRNLEVIAGSPAAGGGDHDFSPYGVESRYQAGRAAAAHLLKMKTRPGKVVSAAGERRRSSAGGPGETVAVANAGTS